MSQNELDEDGDIETDVATDVENIEEENTTSDDDTLTWEELAQLRKDSESLKKANKKIAMLEKDKKTTVVTETSNLSEDALDALLEKRDFYKSNTQAKELREEIEAMVSASKWKVDRDKAFAMLSGDAEIEENRKVYSKPIVNWERTSNVWFSPLPVDKYDRLSDADREAYDAKSMKAKGYIDLK